LAYTGPPDRAADNTRSGGNPTDDQRWHELVFRNRNHAVTLQPHLSVVCLMGAAYLPHGRGYQDLHPSRDGKTGRRHYNRMNDRSLTSADTQLKSHHRSVRQCDSEKCGETPLHFSYDIDGPKVPPSGIVLYATPTESNVLAEKKY
jgi:hypothetical protein